MRILIAEDDIVSRMVLRASVEKLGHECFDAPGGEEAWGRVRELAPDVLITDWMMPDISGPELTRRIRTDYNDAYVYTIILTSLDAGARIIEGMEAGADDYLVKPLDPFQLQTRLIAAARVTGLYKQLDIYRDNLVAANVSLGEAARTDTLTGAGNRLRMKEDLDRTHEVAERYGRPYAVALCDVDSFKHYNDHYGHMAGDEALRVVAGSLRESLRATDALYRFGGEELLVLMAEQDLDGAAIAAERLRASIETLAIPHAKSATGSVITVSVGVAAYQGGRDVEEVVRAADRALYRAKALGRNRTDLDDGSPAASAAS